MIDRELVTRKMVLIGEDLRRLEGLAGKSREEYLASEIAEALAYLAAIRTFLDSRRG